MNDDQSNLAHRPARHFHPQLRQLSRPPANLKIDPGGDWGVDGRVMIGAILTFLRAARRQ
jgi:hypothetical protein